MKRVLAWLIAQGYEIVQDGKYLVKLYNVETQQTAWVAGFNVWIGEERSIRTRVHTAWQQVLAWEQEVRGD